MSTELVRVNSKTVRVCILSMEKWNTTLHLKTKQEEMQSPTHSDTKRNIPGGLSVPLIFCIALIPLTNEINGADCG
jgi:hypothetical protein